jgi:hypothetical protein
MDRPDKGGQMTRRRLLQIVAAIPFLSRIWPWVLGPLRAETATRTRSRVRPADPEWSSEGKCCNFLGPV